MSSSSELGRAGQRVVVTCAAAAAAAPDSDDGGTADAASASSRSKPKASGLSSVALGGPRATRISVTAFDDGAAVSRDPGGIQKLCMIVDRFESDARRISRGSMGEGELQPPPPPSPSQQPRSQARKASHQPTRSPRHRALAATAAQQRSHNDLMLLSPSGKTASTVTSFVESVRKSSFSSKMAEIFDGDSPSGGGGFSVVSCAAAAAVSEVAATVAVNCTAATDDEDDEGEDEGGDLESEVTWRVSTSSSSAVDHVSSTSESFHLSFVRRSRPPIEVHFIAADVWSCPIGLAPKAIPLPLRLMMLLLFEVHQSKVTLLPL